jgi:hypothetical protein
LVSTLFACGRPDDLSTGVKLLPVELQELSGMVAVNPDVLACVQDEKGSVFFVDLKDRQPLSSKPFGPAGDYEGIAATPDGLWVLRSDGALLRLVADGSQLKIRNTYMMPFKGEFEGLCFDAARQRLLVLPKGPIDGKRREKSRRRILGFDLVNMVPMEKPVMTLKVEKVEEQIEDRDLYAPRRTTKKGNLRVDIRLLGSELLVLPGGDILLLSPKDGLLVRVNQDGDVVATSEIDTELLPQPESMALLPDGRLLIGSEGRGGLALIAVVDLPEQPQ